MTTVYEGNIATILWERAERSPLDVAVRDLADGRERSYKELVDRVARVAGGLRAWGLNPGDRVALLMGNSLTYVEAFFGAVAAGLVIVPLNTRLTVGDYAHMLADAQCSALITEQPFLATLRTDPEVPLLRIIDATSGPDPSNDLCTLKRLATGPDPLDQPVPRQSSDTCSLMYTSGTTGKPKAVMLSHHSWSEVAQTALTLLDFGGAVRTMHPAPLTHGAGFVMLPTILAGGTNVTTRSFDPRETARLIASGDVDAMFLVPSMLRMLLDVLPPGFTVPATFRWIYYAGSPIDPRTLREAAVRFDGRLVQSFAQMESPMFLTTLSARDHVRAASDTTTPLAASAGRVIAGRGVRIVKNGVPVDGFDTIGEIEANAPQTMSGYWNRPEASREVLGDDNWLRTGDLGYFDSDGYLYVVDRVKDMIVTGGSNVYATEVEEVLRQIEGVAQVAVVGVPHRIWGEEVTAVLVVHPGADLEAETVRTSRRSALAGYKVPKRVVFVDSLPTNAYGKVLKRALRDRLVSGGATHR